MYLTERRLARRLAATAAGALLCAAMLLCACAGAGPPAGLTTLRLDAAGAEWNAAGRREAAQMVARLQAGFVPAAHWELQTELATQHAQAPGRSLSLGEGISGGALLRFRPSASPWFLQVGAATPLSGGSLELSQRRLARTLAEPLLGFDDSDPLHGWRLHGGAVLGIPLQRGVNLALALGGELAAEFEPAGGVRVDPADRALARVALQLRRADLVAEGRIALTLESEATAAGVVIRERRRIGELAAGLSLVVRGVRLRAEAAYAGTNEVGYFDPVLEGAFRDAGPGVDGRLAAIVAWRDPLGNWAGAPLRGGLRIEYERCMPHGLPVADGWALSFGPEMSLARKNGELTLHLGLGIGHWRRFVAEETPAEREALRGWRIHLARSWQWGAAHRADQAAQGDP